MNNQIDMGQVFQLMFTMMVVTMPIKMIGSAFAAPAYLPKTERKYQPNNEQEVIGFGFTSSGKHGKPSDELELNNRLQPYLEDESKASDDYYRLAEFAESINRRDIAKTLNSMAKDENRHYRNVNEMMRSLRWV